MSTQLRNLKAATLASLIVCLGFVETKAAENSNGINQELSTDRTETWLVVRHADRDGQRDALTSVGERRAETLAELASALRVSTIFTTDYRRTRETIHPSASRLELTPHVYSLRLREGDEQMLEQMRQTHQQQDNDDGSILVVGHSNTVGPMLNLLGVEDSIELEEDEFDRLFLVRVVEGEATMIELSYGQED